MFGRRALLRIPSVAGFPGWDLVLAAVACAVAVASVLTGNPREGPTYVTLPVAVVMALALIFRSRVPVVCAGAIAAAALAQTLLARDPGSLWSLVIFVIAVYSVAAYYTEGLAAVVGVLFVGMLLVEEHIDNGPDYLFIVLLFGGVWLLGRASRLWRTRVSHAEQRQSDLARLAVAEERVRIARELHDIVAHSLSVIAVQADAAEAALNRDPRLAREPIRAINVSSRQSLGEIRDLLQVLRADDDAEMAPARGLDALPELLASARRAGLTVEADIQRVPGSIPPTVDLAAYRILQEALTNAARHAGPVATTVLVDQRDGGIRLIVTNAAGTPSRGVTGSGVGLLGVRERVAAVGGTLETGATPDGGYRLCAVLPLEGMPS